MTEHTTTMTGGDDKAAPTPGDSGLVLVFAADLAASPRGLVLSGRSYVVGREPGPGGFVLAQPAVSRMHAALFVDEAGVRIKDMGSRNGTWVNGARIEEVRLSPGDDVRIGDALFVFVDADAGAHVRYRNDGSIEPGGTPVTIPNMAGGLAMAKLSAEVQAAVRAATTVLVLGETGVGKDLVARGIHELTGRAGPLVAVNCAALSPQLVESELFGYERGAFSGATRSHEGLVRSANRGTLFLDEVGDLSIDAQAKLLRVLEAREVLPIGATRPVPVDIRVVCATHQKLPLLVRDQRFRGDLYARIAGYTIDVPPLRRHKEDLLFLVHHFIARAGCAHVVPSFAFMAKLVRHAWPFNVRELASVVHRAANLASEGQLRIAHLPADFGAGDESSLAPASEDPKPQSPSSQSPSGRRSAPTPEALTKMLVAHEGNVAAVARELDRDPALIYRWLKRFTIDPDAFRAPGDPARRR
jgi:transcriptional regulator of acetoin/glycerol metabolism